MEAFVAQLEVDSSPTSNMAHMATFEVYKELKIEGYFGWARDELGLIADADSERGVAVEQALLPAEADVHAARHKGFDTARIAMHAGWEAYMDLGGLGLQDLHWPSHFEDMDRVSNSGRQASRSAGFVVFVPEVDNRRSIGE